MPMFENRERAFEAKFAHDEEFRFLVTARRDKLFARRVAGQLGLADQAAGNLISAALALPDGPGHDAALFGHMAKVIAEHGRNADAAELAALLANCAKQAQQQLLANVPTGPWPQPGGNGGAGSFRCCPCGAQCGQQRVHRLHLSPAGPVMGRPGDALSGSRGGAFCGRQSAGRLGTEFTLDIRAAERGKTSPLRSGRRCWSA